MHENVPGIAIDKFVPTPLYYYQQHRMANAKVTVVRIPLKTFANWAESALAEL